MKEKVYIVTQGDYSDYHIEKVFKDIEQARLYALMNPDREVEVYEISDGEIETGSNLITVDYSFNENKILVIRFSGKPCLPHVNDEWRTCFRFQVSMTSKRIYESIIRSGEKSRILLRIAQEKFATYLYEHGISKEQLNKQIEEARKKRWGSQYHMFTTTADTSFQTPIIIAAENTNAIIRKIMADGNPAPPYEEVARIYIEEKAKAESEGETQE